MNIKRGDRDKGKGKLEFKTPVEVSDQLHSHHLEGLMTLRDSLLRLLETVDRICKH